MGWTIREREGVVELCIDKELNVDDEVPILMDVRDASFAVENHERIKVVSAKYNEISLLLENFRRTCDVLEIPVSTYDFVDKVNAMKKGDFATHNYLMTKEVPFSSLVAASKEFLIRDIDDEYVADLVGKLLSAGCPIISSLLTVIWKDDKYEIIDGNHRFTAMDTIRKFHHPTWFQNVLVIVYKRMDVSQATKLACSRNADSNKSKRMTDFEIVTCLRKLQKEELSLDRIYKIFRATARSERQALQTHLHVSTFEDEAYDLIKPEFKKGLLKSSTFNVLRSMSSLQKMQCLQEFKESNYKKSVLRKCTSKIKLKMHKKDDSPLQLEVDGNTSISISKKSCTLTSTSLICLGVKLKPSELSLCMREGLRAVLDARTLDDENVAPIQQPLASDEDNEQGDDETESKDTEHVEAENKDEDDMAGQIDSDQVEAEAKDGDEITGHLNLELLVEDTKDGSVMTRPQNAEEVKVEINNADDVTERISTKLMKAETEDEDDKIGPLSSGEVTAATQDGNDVMRLRNPYQVEASTKDEVEETNAQQIVIEPILPEAQMTLGDHAVKSNISKSKRKMTAEKEVAKKRKECVYENEPKPGCSNETPMAVEEPADKECQALKLGPLNFTKGDIVLINAPTDQRMKYDQVPWLGVVAKVSSKELTLDWMTPRNGTWVTGQEGREKVAKSLVLAKFQWNLSGVMPHEKRIWQLAGLEKEAK